MNQPTARPTNKWLAALVSGLGTIAVMALTTGSWDTEESVALVGLLVERMVSYLVPNEPPILEADGRRGFVSLEFLIQALIAIVVIVVLFLLLFKLIDRL
jgi:hypothetical protein